MPKLACPCGFVHNLSPIPDDGWIPIRDIDFESLLDAEVRLREIEATCGNAMPPKRHPDLDEWQKCDDFIGSALSSLYECPECGRLMWKRRGEDRYTVYFKEEY